MRLIDLDGSGGNQDMSLSAKAVIFPAMITIICVVGVGRSGRLFGQCVELCEERRGAGERCVGLARSW